MVHTGVTWAAAATCDGGVTVWRYHYETGRQIEEQQIDEHWAAILDAYNFAKRLKTLCGLTPYEWADQPDRFRSDPTHLTSEPSTQALRMCMCNVISIEAFGPCSRLAMSDGIEVPNRTWNGFDFTGQP